MKQVIVGQLGPIHAVGAAIRRRENGWHDENRPLVLLFLGSSGVGKTELAKQLAKHLHKDPNSGFIRIDMTEFQSKHEVSKVRTLLTLLCTHELIGSIVYWQSSWLRWLRRRRAAYRETSAKYALLFSMYTRQFFVANAENVVVLLDEVEKAHPDVLNVMLQVFDEGRLTDGRGVTVDCRNAIFVMTSNLAQNEIASAASLLRETSDISDTMMMPPNVVEAEEPTFDEFSASPPEKLHHFMEETIFPILRGHFKRDEFLGRIDDMLLFLPFNQTELKEIAFKSLQKWIDRASATISSSIYRFLSQ